MAFTAAGIDLPERYIQKLLDQGSFGGMRPQNGASSLVNWRVLTFQLMKIDFNARDGLNDQELVLVAQGMSKNLGFVDTDGDGKVEADEIVHFFTRVLRFFVNLALPIAISSSTLHHSKRSSESRCLCPSCLPTECARRA